MAKKKRAISTGEAAMDMTPMIDIVFQLIIFFILTVNADQESIRQQIALPLSPNSIERVKKDPRTLTIQVDKSGDFYVGHMKYNDKTLKKLLNNTIKYSGTFPILIRGDEESKHKAIRQAMDACAQAGIAKIRFAALKKTGQSKSTRPPGG